jgi:predicted N-acyltransferase
MYEKTHSAGEFVFDWSWADAAQRAGIPYYPKGVVAVPFTPASGRRLLVDPDHDSADAIRDELIDSAIALCERSGLSSLHFDFIRDEERAPLDEAGCALRNDIQYQWYNGLKSGAREPYDDFEDFLSELRSKRRSNIKRERRKLREKGVDIRVVRGEALSQEALDTHMRRMFGYYRNTVNKFFYGNLYLNEAFFVEIGRKMAEQVHLVVAEKDGEEFAGAFNMEGRSEGSDVLWGRYWGQSRDVDYTHFEVCFYKPVEWCIDQGIDRFEAGAGGDHKHDRGFQPTRTYSAHHIEHPRLSEAIEDVIRRETIAINDRVSRMEENSPIKRVRQRASD